MHSGVHFCLTTLQRGVSTSCVPAGTLGWVGLGLFAFGPGTALLFLLLTNLGLAFGDVIVVSGGLQCSYVFAPGSRHSGWLSSSECYRDGVPKCCNIRL